VESLEKLVEVETDTINTRPTIGCCMIVKNEANILRRTLDSVKPIVDRFFIADTGSTDNTKEIIKEYGELIELPFINFVSTKNEVLKMADTDYILWMDADEIVYQGLEFLREHADSGSECVSCKITEGPSEDYYSIIVNQYDRNRMWKNNGKVKFEGPGVHEVACGPVNVITDLRILVRHEHVGKREEQLSGERFNQYETILLDFIDKNPEDSRAWFYLARTYKDLGRPLDAIQTYLKYISIPNNMYTDEIWQAYYDLALCYLNVQEIDKALVSCYKAISTDSRRSEAYNIIAVININLQHYDVAVENYRTAIKSVPYTTLFLNPLEYNVVPLDGLVLAHFKNKEFDLAEQACTTLINTNRSLDTRVQNNMWWCRAKSRMKIFMNLGQTPEEIHGGILYDRGAHGVETTYIELSQELAKRGHTVFLFCTTEKEHIYENVYYVPFQHIDQYVSINPDVVITSRWFDSFNLTSSAKKILWLQDANPLEGSYDFSKVDLVVTSSQWHMNYISSLTGDRLKNDKKKVITLGVRKSSFSNVLPKEPFKVIYSSNPNRGLDSLAMMWEELVREIPQIQLTVLYGWESLLTWSNESQWQENVSKERQNVIETFQRVGHVLFRGRVNKQTLAYEMMTSSLMLYPCHFWETFCLSALEAQISGTPVVTTDIGALSNIVHKDYNIMLEGNSMSKHYQRQFIDRTKELLTDREKLNTFSSNNRFFFMNNSYDWSDVTNIWIKSMWSLMEV
jgi:glycosyltransferase involved in cell wall biosynthesis